MSSRGGGCGGRGNELGLVLLALLGCARGYTRARRPEVLADRLVQVEETRCFREVRVIRELLAVEDQLLRDDFRFIKFIHDL